jgi:hypothetical protein
MGVAGVYFECLYSTCHLNLNDTTSMDIRGSSCTHNLDDGGPTRIAFSSESIRHP